MKTDEQYYEDWQGYYRQCELDQVPENDIQGCAEWIASAKEVDTQALETENAMLKQELDGLKLELDFLARLDTEVSKWHTAHRAKPNNLPTINEIASIEERILNMALSERKDK